MDQARDAPSIECGDQARAKFSFAPGYTNLNHGSFGAIPDEVRALQRHYQDQADSAPDLFIRYIYPALLSENRQAIADFLSVSKTDIVFVPNATVAINTILRNLVFQPGDICLYFSTTYDSVQKTLLYLAEITPLKLQKIDLTYPATDQVILELFSNAIDSICSTAYRPRLAIFDTISSVPGMRLPFEGLNRICRTRGLLSLIDGAQSVGQIEVPLQDLDPDFFFANLHKWLHVPRPCAILYVAQRNQHLIRSSLPTSHGFVPKDSESVNNPLPTTEKLSEFQGNFEFTGTLDTTAYICVRQALAWRSRLRYGNLQGEVAIREWLSQSASEAAFLLSQRLGTSVMETSDIASCAFSNVELPIRYENVYGDDPISFQRVLSLARWIEKELVDRHNTFILVYWHAGRYWTRLSAQVYLTMADWAKAGDWLLQVCRLAPTHYR